MRRLPLIGLAAVALAASALPSDAALAPKVVDITAAYNNHCMAPGLTAFEGNCDGGARSLRNDTFPNGKTAVLNTVPYAFPANAGLSGNDNVQMNGQILSLPAVKGYSYLNLLTTATNVAGAQRREVTITYTDGTSTKAKFTTYDWVNGDKGQNAVLTGISQDWTGTTGQAVANAAGQQGAFGPGWIYDSSLPINPKKTLRSVTLPAGNDAVGTLLAATADIHLFAMTLTTKPAPPHKKSGPVFN